MIVVFLNFLSMVWTENSHSLHFQSETFVLKRVDEA